MSYSTTYRLRFDQPDQAAILQAMLPTANLPIGEAREFDDAMDDVANVAEGVTISALVPTEQIRGPSHWSHDGTTFTFVADLLNPSYRHDDSFEAVPGKPSREGVLFDAITSICPLDGAHVVGAWLSEHADSWQPLVVVDGCLLRGFIQGWWPQRTGAEQVVYDGVLDRDAIGPLPNTRTVTIPANAFRRP